MASDGLQPYCGYVLNGKPGKGFKKGSKEDTAKPDRAPKNLPDWVFVVQFCGPVGPGSAHFAGRAEHVMSGQSMGFEKPEELIDFFGRIMSQLKP